MKAITSCIIAALFGLTYGCAGTVPSELASAREAYQTASTGPAAQLVPADLHKAHEALKVAEESYEKDGKSYKTRDLAYVAQRKSEMAVVLASITAERKAKTGSDAEYHAKQGSLLKNRTEELEEARTALEASETSTQVVVAQLTAEQKARAEADQKTADALAELSKLAAVKEEARGLVITLSGSVLFRSGESTLMSGAQSRLDQVAMALLESPDRKVVVEGYTDSQGADGYNVELSQRRANVVRDYLVQQGYPVGNVQARGLGESAPIADNTTAEGRANNRRVELVLEHRVTQ
jgi:outer membrane protein OmpA-like peptidoglycan-associated protein